MFFLRKNIAFIYFFKQLFFIFKQYFEFIVTQVFGLRGMQFKKKLHHQRLG